MVSIIIPNYNHEHYLEERIESVLGQTYGEWELIILDDCSTDGSRQIISRYSDNPRVKHVVCNETNSGSTFRQWEKGIALANGEYVWIAESDDVADPNFLVEILSVMDKDSQVGIAFTGSELIDPESNSLPLDLDLRFVSDFRDCERVTVYYSVDFLRNYMRYTNSLYNASGIVFRRELWYKINHDFAVLKLNGDWICWMRMLSATDKVARINLKLNKFRQHPAKVTSANVRNGNKLMEDIEVLKCIFAGQHVGCLERLSLIGYRYKQILTGNFTPELRKSLLASWRKEFRVGPLSVVFYAAHKLAKMR